MNKNKLSPYIRVAMRSTLTAPFQIENRALFDYELIFVSDGKCRLTIDQADYVCSKNDVVLLRPGVHHKFTCIDHTDFVQPHIHFDVIHSEESSKRVVSFKPMSAMDDEELTLISEDALKEVPIPVVFTPNNLNKFRKIFYDTIELFQRKEYNYELLCKAKMIELLHCLLAQFETDSGIKTDVADPIIAVKNYIDHNYFFIMSLESLSKQFHFNKYTLIRKFKSMFNQNIITYYRNKRIEYIKNVLCTSKTPITELAKRLNFSDIYSFSRFFKTYVGCSPTTYRKQFFINE